MARTWLAAPMAAAILLAGVAAPAAEPPVRPAQTSARTAPGRPPTPGFADLIERLLPAVVSVASLQPAAAPKDEVPDVSALLPPGVPMDELFRDMLERRQRLRRAPPPPRARREALSLGSGFIIDPAGFIVTNDHVVDAASQIRVTLHDGTMLRATLVGRDSRLDLALLKVEPRKPLRAVEWGRSDRLKVGDWVLTVGNPFGLGNSVAAGIVSGRNRDLHNGPFDDYIQTDAAMNSGNSGGPMFDLEGRVVGIDTAIYTPTGGSVGVGFAIPAGVAAPVIDQLRAQGRVVRGYLGVRLQTVTEEVARAVSLEAPRGALVSAVAADGPAARAAIRRGDVVVAVEDVAISSVRQLQRLVAGLPVERAARVTVWREGRELPLTVAIGELPEERRRTAAAAPPPPAEPAPLLGLTLEPATPPVRRSRGFADRLPVVMVADVAPLSPAEEAGLSAGDAILAVDGVAVTTPENLAERIRRAATGPRRTMLVLLDREGERQFVAVPAKPRG